MEFHPPIGRQVVCSGFIKKNETFLLVLCPRFKVWRVPGGRSEAGELIEETFCREMKEELGVEIRPEEASFVGYGQDNQYHHQGQFYTSRLLMFFMVDSGDQEVAVNPDEADEYKWVTWTELQQHENLEGGLRDWLSRHSKSL